MANSPSENDPTIENLLQQRAQFEQWIKRLDSAGDKAPPAVRQKVRADYEARLKGVIEELRGHSSTISEELERHRATQSGLDHERRQVEEDLAEAEVRHAVGEYTDDEWHRLRDQGGDRLGRLRGELSGVGNEIARLAEVQGLIAGTPKRPEPSAPAPTPPAPPPPEAAAPEPEPPAPSSSRPAAPAREPEIVHGPPSDDEMAFLKSVAAEDQRQPAPAPAAPPPAPAPAPAHHAPTAASGGRRPSNPGTSRQAEAPAGGSGASTATTGKPGAAGVAKTLKCGECGTLNRPTEWYCERCGAELAGI
jgi:hypothetical protein